MPKRAYFSAFLVFLAMLLLVGMATYAQADFQATAPALLQAQRQSPALWLLDVGIVGFPAIVFGFSVILIGLQNQSRQQEVHHREQLEAMLGRATKLEAQNGALEERVSERLTTIAAQQKAFETASHTRIVQATETLQTEFSHTAAALQADLTHSIQAMQEPLTRQAQQIEDIHMALQYQSAELQQVRHGLRTPQMALPLRNAALSADEMAALQDIRATPAIASSDADSEPTPTAGAFPAPYDTAELEAFAVAAPLPYEYATGQPDGPDATGNAETTVVLAIQEYDLTDFAFDGDSDDAEALLPPETPRPVLTLQSASTPEPPSEPEAEPVPSAEAQEAPAPQPSSSTLPPLPTEWRLKL